MSSTMPRRIASRRRRLRDHSWNGRPRSAGQLVARFASSRRTSSVNVRGRPPAPLRIEALEAVAVEGLHDLPDVVHLEVHELRDPRGRVPLGGLHDDHGPPQHDDVPRLLHHASQSVPLFVAQFDSQHHECIPATEALQRHQSCRTTFPERALARLHDALWPLLGSAAVAFTSIRD